MRTGRIWNSAVVTVLAVVFLASCATPKKAVAPSPKEAWRGVHVYVESRYELPKLHQALEKVLAPKGLNTLVLEVDYQFQYASHPELSASNAMTKEDARELAALCRRLNVRLIPQFQCFGHQGSRPNLLLEHYPELMAPPKPDYKDPLFYQLSWNPLDPKTNEIVFPMIDELIEAFQTEFFHVGLDEVMLFPDATTPHYNGETHAQVFAKAVNDLHQHIVKERGLTMLMWGDRLLDRSVMRYHRFESSDNGTAPAIDMIPKDIIICDWHYNRMDKYPSVPYFQEKGFRVWPSSWKSPTAALALYNYSHKGATPLMMGHLCTTWCGMANFCKGVLGEDVEALAPQAKWAAATFNATAEVWTK